MWDLSNRDWKRKLLEGGSLVPDLPLFKDETEKALRVFKRLRMHDVVGRPTVADASGPWVYPIVAAIFGSFDVEANRREISEFFWMIPKKNGKTQNAALIMLTAQIVNRRPEAESSLISASMDIASRQYKAAKGAIKLDPELDKIFQPRDHIKTIENRVTGAKLVVRAADENIVTGSISTYTLLDESHIVGSMAAAPELFTEIRGALTSRPDGFFGQITTQSKERPSGQFKQELENARAVRDGKMQLPLLPILYELPVELSRNEGWRNRKYWPILNPNWGRSVDPVYLENQLTTADAAGKPALALFASQHFNVEIGQGLTVDSWSGAEHWPTVAEKTLTLDSLLARSEVVVVGIDGGGLDDLLGFCVIGREKGTLRWLVWVHAWCHRKVLENRLEIAPNLLDFEKDGDLTIVDDVMEIYREVADYVEWFENVELLPEKGAIGVDPYGIQQVIDELKRRNFDVSIETGRLVGVRQGWELTSSIKSSAVQISSGALRHSDQAIMAWAIGNAKQEPKGNAVTITKQTAGTAKIDPLMAFFDASTLMLRNPESNRSVYADRGVLVV